MILVKPSFEIIDKSAYPSILEFIEHIGRVCYKSEDKIGSDTAEKFISRIIKSGHESVLEHGVFCFEIPERVFMRYRGVIIDCIAHIRENSVGFNYSMRGDHSIIVSFNIRTLRDAYKDDPTNPLSHSLLSCLIDRYPVLFNDLMPEQKNNLFNLREINQQEMLETFSKEELLQHYYLTARFICDRGVTHEKVRHRIASYSQESTRYCNYSNDKFNDEISAIDISEGIKLDPVCSKLPTSQQVAIFHEWINAMVDAEKHYFKMIDLGASAQIARDVLSFSTKSEIVMTVNLAELHHVFGLRTDKSAHPQMREIMIPFYSECKNKFIKVFS